MEYIEISGGKKLCGSVMVQGSKNGALPILAASLLNGGKSVIHNCPDISDVIHMVNILEYLGCAVEKRGSSYVIDSTFACSRDIPRQEAVTMRSSIMFAGAMLGRFNCAKVAYPGGCVIGRRPIDMHLFAFEKLGASISEENGFINIFAKRLRGCTIDFPIKSVGATENAIMTAVMAEGRTIIKNAAKEPEIVGLCDYLNCLGARILGGGSDTIIIDQCSLAKSTMYSIIPDRIVAGTYIFGAVATRGIIKLLGINPVHLKSVFDVFKEMGGQYRIFGNGALIDGRCATKCVKYIETDNYPGFPTDLQSQLMVALSVAEGDSVIRETIYEARFGIVSEINKMGGNITINGNVAQIKGVKHLVAKDTFGKDLRGSAALAVAGLMAKGITKVHGCQYIERGYEDICKDFRCLGANIKKVVE